MDIVTTYKCKFCPFSCPWKSGLMSHIRYCHITNKTFVSSQTDRESTNDLDLENEGMISSPDSTIAEIKHNSKKNSPGNMSETCFNKKNDNKEEINFPPNSTKSKYKKEKLNSSSDSSLSERHIFLCGQCSIGFNSLEECKKHMVQDHNLKLQKDVPKQPRKRGRPRTRPIIINSSGGAMKRKSTKRSNMIKSKQKSTIKESNYQTPSSPSVFQAYDYGSETRTSDTKDDNSFLENFGELDYTTDNFDCKYKELSVNVAKLIETSDNTCDSETKSVKRLCHPKEIKEEIDCIPKRKQKRGHVNGRLFRCTRKGCGYRFTTDTNLLFHYSCHAELGRNFICPECQDMFELWRVLVMHLWKEHKVDIDLYSCPKCSYKTYNFFKLDNHQKIHSEERSYICETCGKGFKQISQLRNHLVIHLDRKNVPGKRWYAEQKCDLCDRRFSDTKCLKKHKQAVHSKLKPFVCSYCGHLSARKAMLDLHMRQHTGEKPFACEHCDYRTGDHNSLRRHRMRHTGTKPYKCPHCSYGSIQAISYKTHLRNKHPGMEGLFSCTLCTFKSVSKENYINHMSDHKREDKQNLENPSIPSSLLEPEMQLEILPTEENSDQMQLIDNTLEQLEGILPENITAAQLICSCLNALSQDGMPATLIPGVTVNIPTSDTVSTDGTQTITIQLPSVQDLETYYFTIQQDGTAALVLPDQSEENLDETELVKVQFAEQVLPESAIACDGLQCNDGENETQLQVDNTEAAFEHIESLQKELNFCEIISCNEKPIHTS